MLRNQVHHAGEIALTNFMVTPYGDTLLLGRLNPVEIYTLRTYQDSREQEAYERVVAGVRKVWGAFREADSLWHAIRREGIRQHHLEELLRDRMGERLSHMSRMEGALFLKLLSRATGLTAFQIIRSLKGRFKASLYQLAARKVDLDLKASYDPWHNDYDRRLEEICRLMESGALTPLP
ncbi:MAG: DUF4294 domain-containing protein [Flavobacteriales bacterium]|nr:DUF4294 domain-containing protein [Flavobacteriales bacterium]